MTLLGGKKIPQSIYVNLTRTIKPKQTWISLNQGTNALDHRISNAATHAEACIKTANVCPWKKSARLCRDFVWSHVVLSKVSEFDQWLKLVSLLAFRYPWRKSDAPSWSEAHFPLGSKYEQLPKTIALLEKPTVTGDLYNLIQEKGWQNAVPYDYLIVPCHIMQYHAWMCIGILSFTETL